MKKILIKKEDNYIDFLVKYLNSQWKNEYDLYDKTLLKMYIELGDCRKISNKTGIGYRTVANDVKKIKDNLTKMYNEENSN